MADPNLSTSTPPSKRRGRPIKGNSSGIAVAGDTLESEGSARATKRRKKDQEMTGDEAAITRAKAADRVRKSQVLRALRSTPAWMEADEETRGALEAATVEDLRQHRVSTGQHLSLIHI